MRILGLSEQPKSSLVSVETSFARTAWSQRKIQVAAKNCAKFVHAHSRKPHPNTLRKLCRRTPAQISHNLSTFSDAPAHLSHKFLGTCREWPAHKFCTIFSSTWPVLKICLCTGNECLKVSEETHYLVRICPSSSLITEDFLVLALREGPKIIEDKILTG